MVLLGIGILAGRIMCFWFVKGVLNTFYNIKKFCSYIDNICAHKVVSRKADIFCVNYVKQSKFSAKQSSPRDIIDFLIQATKKCLFFDETLRAHIDVKNVRAKFC